MREGSGPVIIQFFPLRFGDPFNNVLFKNEKIILMYGIGIIATGSDGVLDNSLLLLFE